MRCTVPDHSAAMAGSQAEEEDDEEAAMFLAIGLRRALRDARIRSVSMLYRASLSSGQIWRGATASFSMKMMRFA
ncbi:Os12g0146625 [Oryza sativa Japonica Group]|uniref:Os12g0146625 protein n=1 Tax=Oryza sativa subsp. japonica TaxID=39947 RepID=A0A0P0Y6Z7_ORYSJ|nr:hypothetical protein EE612_057772 [Oryza sativa]BAT15887.1 Os12g0146625 [Oryza sativa Japonica Group]